MAKLIISLVAGAILMFIGAWILAKNELGGRVSKLTRLAHTVCASRIPENPDTDLYTRRFLDMAEKTGLKVLEFDITIEKLSTQNDSGAGKIIQRQFARSSKGNLLISGKLARIQAMVRGKKWLWTLEKNLKTTCILKRFLQRRTPTRIPGLDDLSKTIHPRPIPDM